MTTIELLADMMARDLEMLKWHIADFSEADMLVRPTAGANHTTWQLGHLTVAEGNMTNQFKAGAVPPPPEGYAQMFSKESSKIDDPKAFPKKAEVLEALAAARAAEIAWVRTLSPADLDKPSPEKLQSFAPTVGHFIALGPVHTTMHIGQIQVIRRKLGRPVLF